MQHNILRDSNITKIYLIYQDNGVKRKYQLKLKFMDSKECYFSSSVPVNFSKPKRKTAANIKVYTQDGIYETDVAILDSQLSLCEVIFEVSIPKNWKFTQLRQSSRKLVELPVSIKYNDGYVIENRTYDLSLGGISFLSDAQIPSIYKKLSGILTLELPKETIINFPDGKMTIEAKFCREATDIDEFGDKTLFVYKFIGLSVEDAEILKTFLLSLPD